MTIFRTAEEIAAAEWRLRNPGNVATATILVEASRKFHVSIPMMLSRSRRSRVALARQWAMAEMRKRCGWTLVKIGQVFDRDHTTVVHAIKQQGKPRVWGQAA